VHSTHLIEVVVDWGEYAEALTMLPPRFHPVSVCLYWKDLLNGAGREFQKRKINVVTAGHMADPSFAANFYSILRTCAYSTSNMMGSYSFYSVEMATPFFQYGPVPTFNNNGNDPNRPRGSYTVVSGLGADYEFMRNFVYDLSGTVSISSTLRESCLQKLGADTPINKTELRRAVLASGVREGLKSLPRRARNLSVRLRRALQ
jgi:hypothetical protein